MLTQAELQEYLHYDTDTGIFTWIKKPNNKILKGSRAGSLNKAGYRNIDLLGKKYVAHRLAWLYVHGNFPDGIIDHINHERDDNRLCNLREVSHAENMRNRIRNSNTRVDEAGIWWCKRRKRYIAEITLNRKKVYQKSFTDIDEAINQRKAKLLELGFHENHGEKL